jgi:hypothetical protein
MNVGVDACLIGLERCPIDKTWSGAKPGPALTYRSKLSKFREDDANGADDGFVGMKTHFAVLFSPDEANGQAAAQFAACGLVADSTVEPCAKYVQFRFAHGAFETEDQRCDPSDRSSDSTACDFLFNSGLWFSLSTTLPGKSRMRKLACKELCGGAISDGRPYRDNRSLAITSGDPVIRAKWSPFSSSADCPPVTRILVVKRSSLSRPASGIHVDAPMRQAPDVLL